MNYRHYDYIHSVLRLVSYLRLNAKVVVVSPVRKVPW
jgi:hypothetical protein